MLVLALSPAAAVCFAPGAIRGVAGHAAVSPVAAVFSHLPVFIVSLPALPQRFLSHSPLRQIFWSKAFI